MRIAKDFTLVDQNGKTFNLYDNLTQPIMIVFYPKDESTVCTKQLCSYSNEYSKFTEAGLKIVGINIEDEISHKNFAGRFGLRFPLLSDKDKSVSKAYDALNIAGFNKRKIVIISTDKKIVYEHTSFPAFYEKSDAILDLLSKNKYLKMT
jgi:peroxiredoxin Q/BCP